MDLASPVIDLCAGDFLAMPAPEAVPALHPSGHLPDVDHAQHEESDTADDGPTTGATAKKRGTKEEAMSKEHLLTHEPFNPHCPFCVRDARTPQTTTQIVHTSHLHHTIPTTTK